MSSFSSVENAISNMTLKQYVTIKKTDISDNYISHLIDYSIPGSYSVMDLDRPVAYYVEYLESRYTTREKSQFIDTGIKVNNDLTITMEFNPGMNNSQGWEVYFGTGDMDGSMMNIALRKFSTLRQNMNVWYGYNGDTSRNYAISTSSKNLIVLKNGSVTVNGNKYILPITTINNSYNSTMYLFAGCRKDNLTSDAYNGIWRASSCRIYYFKVEKTSTNEKICEYIPCVDALKNRPGFYDTVTKTIRYQGNSKADELTIGPKVN